MQIKEKLKLEEGRTYPFKINNIVDLPDGNEYFVLLDPNSVKHLLSTRYYKKFNFRIGQTIHCKIDKINCNGKIYLEPEHPIYQSGKSYKFTFQYIEEYKDHIGNVYKFAVFTDVFNIETKVPMEVLPPKLVPGDAVKLNVSRIKKGRLYLSSNGLFDNYFHLEEGKYYYFRIVQLSIFPDNRSFYILKDNKGRAYRLRSKYFDKYGFKIGQSIQCRLIREKNETYLEPKHPRFVIGNEYLFNIFGEDFIDDYPAGKIAVYILGNDYGKPVYVPKSPTICIEDNNKIKCRVKDIRKGQLYLDCQNKKTPSLDEV